MSKKLRTREEAKEWLEAHGVSVERFARALGIDRMSVYNALRAQSRGKRGSSHIAAIALGIKARPDGKALFTMEEIMEGRALKFSWMKVANFTAEVGNQSRQPVESDSTIPPQYRQAMWITR